MSIPDYGYTSEEGMGIAREFADEVLARVGEDQFRLIAVSGSVARGEVVCHDVDIVVVGVGRCTENFDHLIYAIGNEFGERKKAVDLIHPFRKLFSDQEWFYTMSVKVIREAVILYENPRGYLARLRRFLSKDPEHRRIEIALRRDEARYLEMEKAYGFN